MTKPLFFVEGGRVFMDLTRDIEKCINSLGFKFVKEPYNFFTESDAHSFLFYYIFRNAVRNLKIQYKSADGFWTVLVHREYPTSFRYLKESMTEHEKGGRGHYDLVILNPEFINESKMEEIIAKDYKNISTDKKEYFAAAMEFKFIVRPLSANMEREIERDFIKLSWTIDKNDSKAAYMIIFNRCRHEKQYMDKLKKLSLDHPNVKLIYIESLRTSESKTYNLLYRGNWIEKLKLKEC